MKQAPIIKLLLYVVLTVGLIVFMVLFSHSFANRTATRVEIPNVTTDGAPPVTNAPGTVDASPLAQHPSGSNFVVYLALFLGCGVALGLMAAKDLSDYFATGALNFVFNDDLKGQRRPEYDAAEQEWANGNHLEAIRLMREYYRKYPREVYVAIRIAEIYEVNLKNHLAAALEYEEILSKKLPPERWGWAAIHLANIYSGPLNKTEQALELLNRVVKEYGQTAAAKKARTRLGLPDEPAPQPVAAKPAELKIEPKPAILPQGFAPKDVAEQHAEPASATIDEIKREAREEGEEADLPNPAAKNLPAGFRPKEKD